MSAIKDSFTGVFGSKSGAASTGFGPMTSPVTMPTAGALGTTKVSHDYATDRGMGPSGITSGVKQLLLGGAEKEAGMMQQFGQTQAAMEEMKSLDELRKQTAIARQELGGYGEAGERASQQEQALMGLLGPEAQQAALDEFTESPGQRFLRESAEKSIMRQASATGGLGGGQVLSALQEQAIGLAGQSLQDRLNTLAAIRSSGQSAAAGRAELSQGLGRDLAAANTRVGERLALRMGAQASGVLGEAGQHRAAQEQFYQRGLQIGDRIMAGISGGMGGMGGGMSF